MPEKEGIGLWLLAEKPTFWLPLRRSTDHLCSLEEEEDKKEEGGRGKRKRSLHSRELQMNLRGGQQHHGAVLNLQR